MYLIYYYANLTVSIILTLVYVSKWHKYHDTFISMIFLLIPIINAGFLMQATSMDAESSVKSAGITYLSATIMPLLFFICLLIICKIRIRRIVLTVIFAIELGFLVIAATATRHTLLYRKVWMHYENGITYLDKEYGFMHRIIYVFFFVFAVAGIAIVVAKIRKKDVSRRILIIFFSMNIINVISLFAIRVLTPGIASQPIGLVFSQIGLLLIVDRINLYDIDDTVIETVMTRGELGCICFDNKNRFLGANEIAKHWFPELSAIAIDDRMKPGTELSNLILEDLDHDPGETTHETHYLTVKGQILKLECGELYSAKKPCGHQFRITDDTKEQRYIEAALAASKAKSQFLANMSHEIRTPINTVLGLDTMILRESDDKKVVSYAMDIKSAGESLLSIINDVLDMSKIETGKLEIIPAEYELPVLIHDLSNMIQVKLEAKELSFVLDVDESLPSGLFGDDIRIKQILINLLTNAAKYTEQGSVTLSVKRERETYRKPQNQTDAQLSAIVPEQVEGSTADELSAQRERIRIRFSVTDTGIGIKSEDINKLFLQFTRIEEKRNRSIEGTGLGINIVISLLELMGSKLDVHSVYGVGSSFSFVLEQEVTDSTEIGNIAEFISKRTDDYEYVASFEAPEAKILVVDDNAMNLKVFLGLLSDTKVQIDEALSGDEGLELASCEHYDVIFMDHMMPIKDGVETLNELRATQELPSSNSPVVALTANAISGARDFYINAGFDDFLSKPIDSDELERMVAKYLPDELKKPVMKKKDACELSSEGEAYDSSEEGTSAAEAIFEGLPAINGVDWNVGKSRFKTPELFIDSLKFFYEAIDTEAKNLSGYLEQGDMDNFRIKVHAMKSSAAIVGIFPLSGMAAVLEDAAGSGNIDRVEAMSGTFLEEWRSYKERLACTFASKDEDLKTVDNMKVIRGLIEQLGQLAEDFDIAGIDGVTAKLKEYRYEEELAVRMKELFEAVSVLDTDSISSICETIIAG